MRFPKLLVPAFAAAGLFLGAAAIADVPPPLPLQQFIDFYQVVPAPILPALPVTLCVVATPEEAGRPATITADGVIVANFPLMVGPNIVFVPNSDANMYTVSAPGVEGRWFNPGSN